MEPHKILNETEICPGPGGRLVHKTVSNPRNDVSKVYAVTEHHDWVNVVAFTTTEQIILVQQWRAGVNDITTELPGGKIDEGESPFEAGLRELREETGYVPSENSKVEGLGCVLANPAIQNNKMHFIQITDVKKQADVEPDEMENIKVFTRTFDKDYTSTEMLGVSHAYSVLGIEKSRTS